jgi:glycosyltransferase involved in cell wall biosynthesis
MASNNLKISVIATVFNEEENITKFLDSLVSQTVKPSEIIIVDGRSADHTVEKIKAFQQKSKAGKQIRLYIQKGNRSVGRNFAIEHANNTIIAVTDAGGYADRNWLKLITAPFKSQRVKVVSGYYKSLAKDPFEKSVTPYFLVMEDRISPDMEFLPSSRSVAFRKNVWEKVGGYPEKYSHNEDLVFDWEIKALGYKFHFVPEAIVYWHPPRDIWSAARTFFRFAMGDAQSGIKRPNVKYIYLRYILLLEVLSLSSEVFYLFIALYSIWSIQKNFRYVKMVEGLLWLPVIQFISDLAVMTGHLVGLLSKR